MPSVSAKFSPLQWDLLLAIVAVGLVTGPVWIGALGFGDPSYTYERSEVVTDGETVAYGEEPPILFGPVPISDEIACSAAWIQVRTCAFEAQLVENETVPTHIQTENTERSSLPFGEEYGYVSINETLYEAVYTDGEEEGRIYLDLERADPDAALEDVSIAPDRGTVPEAVREAAETGEAETRTDIDVPQTPVEVEGGQYYRVYRSGVTNPSGLEDRFVTLARFGGPIAGLLLFYRLSQRLTVTHVDSVKREPR